MASIYKRGKTWTASVSVPYQGGYKKKTRSGFKTKTEANAWSAKTEGQKYDGELKFDSSLPVGEYFKEWLTVYKTNVHKSTLDGYMNSLKHAQLYFKDTPMNKVTRMMAQKFLNKYGEGKRVSSVKTMRSRLNSLFDDALDEGAITVNPFSKTTAVGDSSKNRDTKFLELDDFLKLIHYLEQHHSVSNDAIWLACLTGARMGEIKALSKQDIDDGVIHITKSLERDTRELKVPKTPNSVRDIDVPKDVTDYLLSLPRTGLLFDRAHTVLNTKLKHVLATLKIEKQISFHGLRHTHASYLIAKDVSVEYISERLGHANIGITQSIYIHLLQNKRNAEKQKTLELLKSI
ncbi:site-specific integrase [Leuconostoc falkenbergense]|uniref:site-specific integrase n=1 Tax=Leuconostoc falkenbergense TaxID=2766470 RepID=UPI0021AAAE91|nr:site-specific integrase [Leuconostoc falkenbergense]MCT4419816.1 site-specific integrase [Leuconostoc falkenbergense]